MRKKFLQNFRKSERLASSRSKRQRSGIRRNHISARVDIARFQLVAIRMAKRTHRKQLRPLRVADIPRRKRRDSATTIREKRAAGFRFSRLKVSTRCLSLVNAALFFCTNADAPLPKADCIIFHAYLYIRVHSSYLVSSLFGGGDGGNPSGKFMSLAFIFSLRFSSPPSPS